MVFVLLVEVSLAQLCIGAALDESTFCYHKDTAGRWTESKHGVDPLRADNLGGAVGRACLDAAPGRQVPGLKDLAGKRIAWRLGLHG